MFFLLTFLVSLSTFAHPDISELSNDPKWLKLLHYKKGVFDGYDSEADSKNFFLHKNGKTNPSEELKSSLAAFSDFKNVNNDHPICKFPLRYKWLNQKLGMPWKADLMQCKTYVDFFSKLAARRASIIFSSYYLSNPNTAFGHTLLRLSRYDDKNETEMLDYGINYAARAHESNPVIYMAKGLFGGFQGELTAIPYYYKIREYTDLEFRDLWSYELKFTPLEVLEMVDHIWELGNTTFDYFYFRENCSYYLLSILEVARPSLELTANYNWYTIPADTLRLLEDQGLIDQGKKRDSTYTRLLNYSEKLSAKELSQAKQIALHPEETKPQLAGVTDAKAADILDVSMEAFDYFNIEKILADDVTTKSLKNNILVARAQNPVVTDHKDSTVDISRESPALSHSPTRWVFAENYYHNIGKSTRFESRFALHDLLDPPQGALKESLLEMGKFSFEVQESHYQDPKLVLDYASIFSLKNYPEQNFWTSPVSWEAELGAKQLRRLDCFNCPAAFAAGAIGNSLQLNQGKFLLAMLLHSEMDLQSQFINNYRFALGPKIFSRYRFSEKIVTGVTSFYHFNTYEHNKFFQDYEWWNELEVRFHLTKRYSLSLKGGGIERARNWMGFGELGLQYFYE